MISQLANKTNNFVHNEMWIDQIKCHKLDFYNCFTLAKPEINYQG